MADAYEEVEDGEWLAFARSGHRIACCDCGLVHDVEFAVTAGKVEMRFTRNNRATAARRRAKNKADPK